MRSIPAPSGRNASRALRLASTLRGVAAARPGGRCAARALRAPLPGIHDWDGGGPALFRGPAAGNRVLRPPRPDGPRCFASPRARRRALHRDEEQGLFLVAAALGLAALFSLARRWRRPAPPSSPPRRVVVAPTARREAFRPDFYFTPFAARSSPRASRRLSPGCRETGPKTWIAAAALGAPRGRAPFVRRHSACSPRRLRLAAYVLRPALAVAGPKVWCNVARAQVSALAPLFAQGSRAARRLHGRKR